MLVVANISILCKILDKTRYKVNKMIKEWKITREKIEVWEVKGKKKVTLHGDEKGIFCYIVWDDLLN